MGEFAVSAGAHYLAGSQRGERSQLNAMGITSEDFFRALGDSINQMMLAHRPEQENIAIACAKRDISQVSSAFAISRSKSDLKSRWIDGTPEYSFYIAGLRKLFPDAKFLHIVREVRAVVDSMLNFKSAAGKGLVETEQEAFEYWFRAAQACLQAEHAYGTSVIHRVRYSDLVEHPESTMRRLLGFLEEPYSEDCVKPLVNKINSSRVPEGFDGRDMRTDNALVDRALKLSDELQRASLATCAPLGLHSQVEENFSKRVAFMATLDAQYADGQKKVALLAKRLNCCGVVLLFELLLIWIAFLAIEASSPYAKVIVILNLLFSGTGILLYAIARRAGLWALLKALRETVARMTTRGELSNSSARSAFGRVRYKLIHIYKMRPKEAKTGRAGRMRLRSE